MKQPLTFSGGDRAKQLAPRGNLPLPSGDRIAGPNGKGELQLPETRNRMMSAEGVRGLHDDMSPATRPLGSLSYCRNLLRVGRTAATTRPGCTRTGAIGGGYCVGMAPLYKSTGEKYLVAGTSTGDIAAYDGNTWRRVGSGWSGDFCAVMFGDQVIMVTGGTDPPLKWDAVSFNGFNVFLEGDPPDGAKFVTTAYRSVFMAGMDTQPHVVYASDGGTFEVWWDTVDANGNPDRGDAATLAVNDMDGDRITWLTTYRDHVLIFKRYSIHELYGPELEQVSDLWRIIQAGGKGTPNGRTVIEIDSVLYWLSDDGIVAWGGGKLEIISDPVRNTMKRINWSQIDKAAAGHDGQGRYLLSVPLDSATSPNATIVYDTREGSWWLWDEWAPTAYARFRIDGAETLCFGDADGDGYTVGGDTDDGPNFTGAEILWEAHFGPSTGGLNYRDKIMRRAYFIASVATGTISASISTSDTAAFGAVVSLPAADETRRIKRTIPISGIEETETFAPTIRLVGRGQATIHDVGLEWTERDT